MTRWSTSSLQKSGIRLGSLFAVLLPVLVTTATLADAQSRGDDRVLWTQSRVRGRPGLPLPFRVERSYARLELQRPIFLIAEPGTRRLLVVEEGSRIVAFEDRPEVDETALFLEVPEHDVYSVAFHPSYTGEGRIFVFTNGPRSGKRRNRIFAYKVAREKPDDPAGRVVENSRELVIEWDSNGHNGGDLAFGNDALLYITSGDGTSDSDANHTGQDITDLASGLLRIDVDRPTDRQRYSVPPDNPFLHLAGARHELWAYGFRNPWRISIDRPSGDIWIGDVGQDLWEFIILAQRGANYGWSVREGSHPFQLQRPVGPTPISPPTIEHHHHESRSITGGHVYRGDALPTIRGAYVYGDYSTGKIWGARHRDGAVSWQQELADSTLQIVSFGIDHADELHIIDHGGGIYHLEPATKKPQADTFPRKLSETGIFSDTTRHIVATGVIPYSVNAPLWSDGAEKKRFIGLAGTATISFRPDGAWELPDESVLVKTFTLDIVRHEDVETMRVETRLLLRTDGEWAGYSYAWNDEQTDATLVDASGLDRVYRARDSRAATGAREQTWRFPSRAECMVCHTRQAGFVLGLRTPQMNRVVDLGPSRRNQLLHLEDSGALLGRNAKQAVDELDRWSDPRDESEDLDRRARSYLGSNCAHCHAPAAGGNSAIDLQASTDPARMRLFWEMPLHERFDIDDARLLVPGDPSRSVLLHRMATHGRGRMPPLASSLVDSIGRKLIERWIREVEPPTF